MALAPSGCSEFDTAVFKAERAYQAALRAAGLTPAQATQAARNYLEAIITAGTLYQVATPGEIATLRELNVSRSIDAKNNATSPVQITAAAGRNDRGRDRFVAPLRSRMAECVVAHRAHANVTGAAPFP
jgi:hypothetical protein